MSTTRTLRRYKGWTYDPELHEFRHLEGRGCWESVSGLINYTIGMNDDDHAQLMDLKKNPYEPLPKLEDVVRQWEEWWNGWIPDQRSEAVRGVLANSLCSRLREAFPHIDTPEGA